MIDIIHFPSSLYLVLVALLNPLVATPLLCKEETCDASDVLIAVLMTVLWTMTEAAEPAITCGATLGGAEEARLVQPRSALTAT